jgi:predicted ATPase/DNA-binding SARP family transcriptional activator
MVPRLAQQPENDRIIFLDNDRSGNIRLSPDENLLSVSIIAQSRYGNVTGSLRNGPTRTSGCVSTHFLIGVPDHRDSSMSPLSFSLLGSPRLTRDGVPLHLHSRKCMALLAYLAVTDSIHTRAPLAVLLWPESNTKRAQNALRSTLSFLRRALDGAWLVVDREAVGLDGTHRLAVDVVRFRDLLQRCRRHGHPVQETCAECWPLLEEAVELYRGDFMDGFTLRDSPQFDDWQSLQTEALRRDLAGALERLAEGHAARGDVGRGIDCARRWLSLDSLNEPAHRALMRLYAWSGQQAAALGQYEACERTLQEELGVPPSAETVDLYTDIREGRTPQLRAHAPAPLRGRAEPRHNLPSQPTPFVGRVPELSKIAGFLADPSCRLLTVVGHGGVGKSRLAIQAAEAQVGAFADGAWFVPLAPLSSVDLLASAIVDALPVSSFGSVDPRVQLLNTLREKRVLLLLDSFEHLLEGATLVTEMLDSAPGLKVLVTSRERLNLRGEWLFPLRGMRAPVDGDTVLSEGAVATLEDYSAVRLFVQCARRAWPDFSLASAEASGAVRICQLVGGMPLAIELAAPWVRMMPCREIAREIEENLDFLTTALRDMPPRHRSMRAVFDHSWRLLSAEERDALSRLSVFRGGFRREAAEAAVGASLPLLSALVDKSWLRSAPSGRYEMHELIRHYTDKKLQIENLNAESSEGGQRESERARDRHSSYYATFLAEREGRLKGHRQREALQQILADIDNVRTAWRWAVDRGDADAIGQCVDALWYLSDLRGWHLEVKETFGRAAARLEELLCLGGDRAPSEQAGLTFVLAQVLSRRAHQCNRLGLREQAVALCEESLALLAQTAHSARQQREYVWAKYVLGWTLLGCGDVPRAHQLAQEALDHSKAADDRWTCTYALYLLGVTAHMQGRYPEAQQLLQQGIAIADDIGEARNKAWGLLGLGGYVSDEGEYRRAEALTREGLRILQELGDRVGTTYALLYLGEVAIALRDYALARRCFQDSLAIANETDSVRYFEAWSLNGLAAIALALGHYAEARRIFTDSVRICEDVGVPSVTVTALTGLGNVSCVLGEYGQSRACFCRALKRTIGGGSIHRVPEVLTGLADLLVREGGGERAAELLGLIRHHPASPYAVRERAKRLLTEVAVELPPQMVAAATARGEAQELADAVANILQSNTQKGSTYAH